MADSTAQSIEITASPDKVMAVIADFADYPRWVAAAKQVEVVESGADGKPRLVRFVLDAGVIKDTYDLRYTWSKDGLKVSWELVRAAIQKAQTGSYTLAPTAKGSTVVTYELMVDLTIPVIGMLKRKAEKVITDTALKELKKQVEG